MLWHALGAGLIVAIFYLSLTSLQVSIPVESGDKIGHIAAYAVLMLWYGQLCGGFTRRLVLALTFVGMGVAIEFLQRETGYRMFEVADMAADGVGVAVGWVLAPPRLPNVLRLIERVVRRR